MLEQVHNHITSELSQNTKTDTIFILTAIFLNLVTLGINSGFIKESRTNSSFLVVMFIFVCLIIVVNGVVVLGLMKGKQTREKLLKGLIEMYRDKEVDKY